MDLNISDFENELSNHNQMFQQAYFLSDWNNTDAKRPYYLFNQANEQVKKNIDTYFFPSDEIGQDKIAQYNNSHRQTRISADNIVIASNGTSLLFFLIIDSVMNGNSVFLIFTPVYYTVIEIIRLFNLSAEIFEINFPYKQVNWDLVNSIVQKRKINCLVITDPIWGSGLSLTNSDYKSLLKIANVNSCHIIIDNTRGGMKWNGKCNDAGCDVLGYIPNLKHFSIIDSPCKRLFLNGEKFAISYTEEKVKKRLDHLIEIISGSMSSIQVLLMQEIFKEESYKETCETINANISKAINNYELLNSALMGNNIVLSRPDNGYYAMLGLPRDTFEKQDDYHIFHELLFRFHTYSIPMSLSQCNNDQYYLLRINLLLPINTTIEVIRSLLLIN